MFFRPFYILLPPEYKVYFKNKEQRLKFLIGFKEFTDVKTPGAVSSGVTPIEYTWLVTDSAVRLAVSTVIFLLLTIF